MNQQPVARLAEAKSDEELARELEEKDRQEQDAAYALQYPPLPAL